MAIEMKMKTMHGEGNYDIGKAHGGELRVDTKEGKDAEFIVQLPCA
jgi:hypothetical protein